MDPLDKESYGILILTEQTKIKRKKIISQKCWKNILAKYNRKLYNPQYLPVPTPTTQKLNEKPVFIHVNKTYVPNLKETTI